MVFKDRHDAGKQLAQALIHYQNTPNGIIIGLPRGGVVVAYEVAKILQLPLDVTCPRKIGAPQNPELAIGAITETGEGIFDEALIQRLQIPQNEIEKTMAHEKNVAIQRIKSFRKGRLKLNIENKVVILIDDGLATGSTMRAAIKSIKAGKPAKIIVAIPTAPFETVEVIRAEVSEIVCLDCPLFFQAIGQFYEDFSQTEDDEVISLLMKTC